LTKKKQVSQETLTKNLCCGLVLSRNLDKNVFIAKKPSIKQGLPVEKKTLLTAVCISLLLFSAVAGTQLLNLGRANPYKWVGDVPPDANTKPPAITIFYPENNTVYPSNNLTISFNVRLLPSPTASHPKIYTVYYKTSWQNDSVIIYQWSYHVLENPYDDDPELTEFSHKLNLTSIPEGNHNITIQATEYGIYLNSSAGYGPFGYNTFSITGSSSISFTIDTTPPTTAKPEPFPTTLVVAPVASVVVIGAVLAIYFKKRKR
jgi:hypothetical protein